MRMDRIDVILSFLPVIIMMEAVVAGMVYFLMGRLGSGVYWVGVGVVTWAAVFGIKMLG
jgi:hypothetical protein